MRASALSVSTIRTATPGSSFAGAAMDTSGLDKIEKGPAAARNSRLFMLVFAHVAWIDIALPEAVRQIREWARHPCFTRRGAEQIRVDRIEHGYLRPLAARNQCH